MLMVYVVIAIVAYLIGAIPVGVLVGATRGVDVRQHGSGKTGTTNVLRTVGKRAAVMVLIGDFLKGSLAVWVGRMIAEAFLTPEARVGWLDNAVSVMTLASAVAAIAVVCGHVWSLYLRLLTGNWSGGRGVATALGAMLVINPWIMLLVLAVGVPTIMISRYVSLGSILGAAAGGIAVILLVIFGYMDVFSLVFVALAAFIIWAHRDNIQRLLKGTERKLGENAKA